MKKIQIKTLIKVSFFLLLKNYFKLIYPNILINYDMIVEYESNKGYSQ